jgi:hypothetical protein
VSFRFICPYVILKRFHSHAFYFLPSLPSLPSLLLQDELDEKHRILPPALRSMVMMGVVGAICLTGMMSFFQFW